MEKLKQYVPYYPPQDACTETVQLTSKTRQAGGREASFSVPCVVPPSSNSWRTWLWLETEQVVAHISGEDLQQIPMCT